MHGALLLLMLLDTPAASSIPVQHGMQLTYRGNLVADKGDPAASEKTFRYSALLAPGEGDKGTSIYWTVAEQGRGGWSWLDRFGRIDLSRAWRTREAAEPALLYRREEGRSIVPLRHPLLLTEKTLEVGTRWVQGRLEYEVVEDRQLRDYDTWRIEVGNAYGRQRTLWVTKESRVVVALEENVVLGQGERHSLRYALVSHEPLADEPADSAIAAFESLLELREKLGVDPQTAKPRWTPERLKQLQEALPELAQQAEKTPLETIVQAAGRNARQQQQQSGAVGALQEKYVGTKAPRPELTTLDGEPFDWESLEDKVVVLHFWDYRDEPLEDPYGQIAYLDFLYRRRESEEIGVFGVAVNPQLAEAATREEAIRGVKNLQQFMNLSYPLLLDGGDGIRAYGDPEATGAELPLFVVIGRGGDVLHYHVGTYDVTRDRGLDELNRVITKALGDSG